MLRIYLLGNFRVELDGNLISDWAWQRRKASRLLKLLALRPGHQLHREQVCELLWPDIKPELAQDNLYRTLYYLRRALEPSLTNFAQSRYIKFRKEIIRLDESAGLWVDLSEFKGLVGQADTARDRLATLEEAVSLYKGDLLEDDPYEEWLLSARETTWRMFAEVLKELAALYRQRGDYSEASALLERVMAREPLDEITLQDLMFTYALAGRRYEAIRQYLECRKLLDADLGLEPLPSTLALYQRILAGQIEPEQVIRFSQVQTLNPAKYQTSA